MKMNHTCLMCLLRRNLDRASKLGDEDKTMEFARDLLKMLSQVPEDAAAPYCAPYTAALFQKHYGLPKDYLAAEKEFSNRFVLERLPKIQAQIEGASDPVLRAMQAAVWGNYLDFAALHGQVRFDEFDELMEKVGDIQLDAAEFENFRADLSKAQRLLYLTDNAGEVVFDMLLGQCLRKAYPTLEITYCVRGGPALNDATRKDASAIGLDREFPVIDNGTEISGTDLARIGPELRAALENADVVLAKGQGNLETMLGCGKNVYYAFLCKCQRFRDLFHAQQLQVMFCNDRRIRLS